MTLDVLVNCRKEMFNVDNKNTDISITERISIYLLISYLHKGHIRY